MNLNNNLIKSKISLVLNIVFIVYALTFIISSGLERITIFLSTILWIFEGNFKAKLSKIISQKVIVFYFSIIVLFLISVFFSDSISHGFIQAKYHNSYSYIFHKNIVYFMMAVYLSTSLKPKFYKYVLYAFLLQILYMTFNVYYLYFTEYIDGNKFTYYILSTNRIFYSIALNIGLMLFISLFLQISKKTLKIFIVILLFLIVFSILLLGSRAGIFALIVNFMILFIYFAKRYANYKYIAIGIILSSTILLMSYTFIPQVKYRLDMAISDLNKVYTVHNYNSSLGIRVGLYETSLELLFKDVNSIICGLCYGDAKLKFKNYLEKHAPDKYFISKQPHVHNQYLQTWINGGILAMLLYIIMLIHLVKLHIPNNFILGLYGFVASFTILGFSDIIYHRGTVLGLFAFAVGLFLALENFIKYFNNELNRKFL